AIDAACVTQTDAPAHSAGPELPLLDLATLLGANGYDESAERVVINWKPPATSSRSNGDEGYRIALDGIVGRQEVLVRSLGRPNARHAGRGCEPRLPDDRQFRRGRFDNPRH